MFLFKSGHKGVRITRDASCSLYTTSYLYISFESKLRTKRNVTITFMPKDVSGYLSKVALTAEIPSELEMFVYNAFKSIFTTRKLAVGGSQQNFKIISTMTSYRTNNWSSRISDFIYFWKARSV